MTICLPSLTCLSRFLKQKYTFIAFLLEVDNRPAAPVILRPYLSFNTLSCYTCIQKGWFTIIKKRCVGLYILRRSDMIHLCDVACGTKWGMSRIESCLEDPMALETVSEETWCVMLLFPMRNEKNLERHKRVLFEGLGKM
ncbi:hypothetical protein TNCV_4991741 [Trichonephila clavipes]|nr:hypothetical protein TNCV_4991741 [Trichonephila clavipes]